MPTIKRTKEAVSVIGLGAMGTALTEALLKAGHSTTVWNRTASKAEKFTDQGATVASTAEEAIEVSPITIICVTNYAAFYDVLEPIPDTISDKIIVNLTNGTPKDARQASEWVSGHSAEYLDGGIMAVPSMIGQPEAFILYSGSQEAFDNYEDTLNSMGGAVYKGTDPGRAALFDLALLNGMYGMFGGFLQAVALVGTENIKATSFTSDLLIPWLKGLTAAMPELARQIDTGDYTSKESNLAMQTSGTSFAEFNESVGISSELIAPLEKLMKQRVADGHGGDDFSSVIELIRKN